MRVIGQPPPAQWFINHWLDSAAMDTASYHRSYGFGSSAWLPRVLQVALGLLKSHHFGLSKEEVSSLECPWEVSKDTDRDGALTVPGIEDTEK